MEYRESGDFFQHRYYRINSVLLKLTGQWPYQSTRTRCVLVAIAFLIIFSSIIPQTIAVIKRLNDWDFLISCVTPLTFDCVLLSKFLCSTLNTKEMLMLLNRIRMDWNVLAPDGDVDILHEYATRGRQLTILYAVGALVTYVFFVTQPIVPKIIDVFLKNDTEPGEFPLAVDYLIIDAQKYYFHIVLHCCVSIYTAFIIVIAHDTLFILYILHGCGLYAILGYAALIEATYLWCLFFVVGFNMFLITVTGLQVVTTIGPQETLKFVVINVAAMTILCIQCSLTQALMDYSIIIRYYMINCKWYKLPLKSQKMLLLIIMRCNVPCTITAGKVFIMSIKMFTVVLKTSLSYFSLLRSL